MSQILSARPTSVVRGSSVAVLPALVGGADPEQKFDRRAAAQYLGVSDRTLENWAVRGGGPRFIKASRRVVYRRRDLEAWLAARERISTSDRGEAA